MPPTFYTKEEYERVRNDKNCYSHLIDSILNYYRYKDEDKRHKSLREKTYSKLEKARYNFIPLNMNVVMNILNELHDSIISKGKYDSRYVKFLDAGCGIGWIVKLAQAIGFNASGIELDKDNVKVATTIFGLDDRVKQGDILQHKYSTYDIIYYYCPIADTKLQKQFERKVEEGMKVGSILVPCMKQDKRINKDKRFKLVSKPDKQHIWKKVKEDK